MALSTRALGFALSVALLAVTSTACSGDPGEATDSESDALTGCAVTTDSFYYVPGGGLEALAKNLPRGACTSTYLPVAAFAFGEKGATYSKVIRQIHEAGFHAAVEVQSANIRAQMPCDADGDDFAAAGRTFRARMARSQASEDLSVAANIPSDTWYLNELGTALTVGGSVECGGKRRAVSAHEYRAKIARLLEGLGAAGEMTLDGVRYAWPRKKGIVLRTGHPQREMALAGYKQGVEGWLVDEAFWGAVDAHVRMWGEEVYASTEETCVAGASPDAQEAHLTAYTHHLTALANAADRDPRAEAAARVLAKVFLPLMNGSLFHDDGYGTTLVDDPGDAARFVDLEIDAARRHDDAQGAKRRRFGLAWLRPYLDGNTGRPTVVKANIVEACRKHTGGSACRALLANVNGANETYTKAGQELLDMVYAPALGKALASPERRYCSVTSPKARFNPAWATFGSW